MIQPMILHELEEYGQSRKEDLSEIAVVACRTALRAFGTSLIWGSVITGGRYLFGDYISLWSALATYGAVFVIRFGLSVEGDLDEHLEGLRSEKMATTYAPPQPPEPAPIPVPPIQVNKPDGSSYILDRDPVPQLPDGRKVEAGLNIETLAIVLREILERHDGNWSRDRFMGIKVNGRNLSRKLYEAITTDLAKVGFLQERPQGGFELPSTVTCYNDLKCYFPGLPGLPGQPDGRRAGRTAGPGGAGKQPANPGRGLSLAERRKQKFLELGCDVAAYQKVRTTL